MERRKFLKQTVLSILGLVIAPKIIDTIKTESHLYSASRNTNGTTEKYIDGKYSGFDFSNIDCFYDFTSEDYSIKDKKGNIVGWKDISGHGHDGILTTTNPVYPYKKFLMSKNNYYTDNYVEKILKK